MPMLPVQNLPPPARHSRLTMALHWLSALLIVTAFTLIWCREEIDDKPIRATLLLGHSQAGLLVLLLLALRLWARVRSAGRAPAVPGPRWMQWAGSASHLALYLLLLAQPLLGWALMNAHGHDAMLFGVLRLPALAPLDPDVADTLGEIHETAGWALLVLIGLHAGAALWHHIVRRDNVLASMWPYAALRK